MKHTKSQALALKCLISGVALGLSSAAMAVPTVTFQSNNCPGICTDLATSGLNASGGGIVSPAVSIGGQYRIPGTNDGNGLTSVTSYNVTSSLNSPTGATTPITITGLDGLLDFYWGSIDSYNVVEFFLGAASAGTITGNDVEGLTGGSDGGAQQYNTDGYFLFEGDFNKAVLSSSNGVAFEVARAVPEPGTLALLGLGLAGLGVARRRKQA